jgi:ADP-heptose:LPS heptosyltransferase
VPETSLPRHPTTPSLRHGVSVVIPIVAGIGNALLAVPMIRQLKRKRPDARTTVLARIDAMAEVFRRLPEVDETIVTGKGWRGLKNMVLGSRRRKPDAYLVPFPSNRWQYSMLALTSGARRRVLHAYPVGYWRALHFLPATRVLARRGIHDVEQNLGLLRALGIEPDAPEAPTFALTDEDRRSAASRIGNLPDDLRPIIVHAGSANTVLARAKRWSSESYAQLIDALSREFGAERILLVEGPDEAGVAQEITGIRDTTASRVRVIRMTGPLSDAAVLLERAALYVGSDSGLAHLAAAVGTPAVTIFAPADPDRVCPFGYRELVVQPPTGCTPCFKYPWESPYPKMECREPFCVRQVSVEAVMDAVRRGMRLGDAAGSATPAAADHGTRTVVSPAPATGERA